MTMPDLVELKIMLDALDGDVAGITAGCEGSMDGELDDLVIACRLIIGTAQDVRRARVRRGTTVTLVTL
jgi:hypothetical protein